jgi:hypothetical protein
VKLLAALFIGFFSLSAYATPVDGEIFYITPTSGNLVSRDVTLEVPSRGQGEVVLSGKNFTWRTTDFWSVMKNGKTTFYAAFETKFMNFTSTILLKGVYLKAKDKIKYYGSFYKKPGHGAYKKDLSQFTYDGGFEFNYDR